MHNESNARVSIKTTMTRKQFDERFAQSKERENENSEKNRIDALKKLNLVNPFDIAEGIKTLADCDSATPTGFPTIDKALGGGLKGYLYVLGAGSSLGKTTLTVQMADQIAASGKPVAFISIEQSGREIVLKSLSRIMADLRQPATVQELESREQRNQWDEEKKSAFDMAYTVYGQTSETLKIMEGNGQPTAASVREAVKGMREFYGVAPVVFVDYLQLLTSDSALDDERRVTNHNITALKQIARDFNTPVVAISSLNRSGYNSPVSLDSFKESGAIEYTADVLMGLQPRGLLKQLDGESTDMAKRGKASKIISESKTQSVRQVELTVLKHRMGIVPKQAIPLTFYPACSTFVDDEAHKAASNARIVA